LVIILAKGYPPSLGGVETYSEDIAKAYRDLGYKPMVITQYPGAIGVRRRARVTVVNLGPGSQVILFFKFWIIIKRIIDTMSPFFVHATTWRMAFPALAHLRGIPIFVTVHGAEISRPNSILKKLMRFIFRHVSLALVVSHYTLERAGQDLSNLFEKAIVSWNGLTYHRQASQASPAYNKLKNRVTILSACRLAARKNLQTALRAVAEVETKIPFRLLITGQGEEENELKRLTKDLNLSDKVFFLGYVNEQELVSLYCSADIFLHPHITIGHKGDYEGFGLTIVNAMSFGVPVITGTEGAPREYIINNINGLLVDARNKKEIVKAVTKLIESRSERRRIGRNGRDWALQNLSWKQHVQRLLDAASDRGIFGK